MNARDGGRGKEFRELVAPPLSPPYSLGGVGIGWSVPARVFGSFVGVWMALPLFPATAGSECEVENLLLFIPDCCFMWCHVSLSFIPEIWNRLFIKFTLSNPPKKSTHVSHICGWINIFSYYKYFLYSKIWCLFGIPWDFLLLHWRAATKTSLLSSHTFILNVGAS